MRKMIFPFTAVLGQEQMKNALLWNFVNPRIGGVLVSGQKGTAKSTLVRASEKISRKKIVELPLNITEDRLIGTIDFEYAVKFGKKKLDKGILAQADNNILYVDEINLLSDHIVKALLEAASEGVCRVEREGMSETYPCEFILIGSMNPEESGLRPQLLDRFGLYVDVSGEDIPLIRCEIVKRRIAFEQDPEGFCRRYEPQEERLADEIQQARKRLKDVQVSDAALGLAAQLSQKACCEGIRAEKTIIETARAICALQGISSVNKEAVTEAAKYALPHRMRDMPEQQQETTPQEEQQNEQKEEQQDREQQTDQEPQNQEADSGEEAQAEEEPRESVSDETQQANGDNDGQEKTDSADDPFEVIKWLTDGRERLKVRKGNGRRSLVKTDSAQGRYVKSTSVVRDNMDIAFDATLRAAAPYQKTRKREEVALAIEKSDLRVKVREKRTGNFIVFVVDASSSMGVGKRMRAVKGAVLSLLSDAYQKRDRVALITFRKDRAELALGMTRSVDLAAKKLETLSTGGKTPLYAGLEMAHQIVRAAKRREKDLMPVIVLISDGRATYGRGQKPFEDALAEARAIEAEGIKSVVIDVEQDFIKLNLAGKLAKEMNAGIYKISELHAGAILSAVRMAVSS